MKKKGYAPIWTPRHTKVVEDYIQRCKELKEKFYTMDRYGQFRALSHEENLIMCKQVTERLKADIDLLSGRVNEVTLVRLVIIEYDHCICESCGKQIKVGEKAVKQIDQEDLDVEYYHHTKKCCEETFEDYRKITETEVEMDFI